MLKKLAVLALLAGLVAVVVQEFPALRRELKIVRM